MRKYVARCKANVYMEHQQNFIIQFSEGLCKEKSVICVLCIWDLKNHVSLLQINTLFKFKCIYN